jgi:outer membrane protein OmpA-like peptidoglycan-associated protein
MKWTHTLLNIVAFFSFLNASRANHIIGGEINYEIINTIDNKVTYLISIRLTRDEGCSGCMTLGDVINVEIIDLDDALDAEVAAFSTNKECRLLHKKTEMMEAKPRCLVNDPNIFFMTYTYQTKATLSKNKNGYLITHNACCRVLNIRNLENYRGFAYQNVIPGILQNNNSLLLDNSPVFKNEIALICRENKFKLQLGASDPDGDSLSYAFVNSYEEFNFKPGASKKNRFAVAKIKHKKEYPFDHPLGLDCHINNLTGEISGISPEPGRYLINVAVRSYRNGTLVNETQKDLIITISDCDFPSATLKETYGVCIPQSLRLENEHHTPLNETYRWDIQDLETNQLDVRREESVLFDKKTPGTYKVRLIVNEAKECTDTAYTQVVISDVKAKMEPVSGSESQGQLSFSDKSDFYNSKPKSRVWMIANDTLISVSKDQSETIHFKDSAHQFHKVILITTNEFQCIDTAFFTLKPSPKKRHQKMIQDDFTVHFETNSDQLTNKAKQKLDSFIQYALNKSISTIQIDGHTDNSGSSAMNQSLSDLRAKRVADYLREHGLGHLSIETAGFADTAPIAENETAEGKKRNRRTEIKPVFE